MLGKRPCFQLVSYCSLVPTCSQLFLNKKSKIVEFLYFLIKVDENIVYIL